MYTRVQEAMLAKRYPMRGVSASSPPPPGERHSSLFLFFSIAFSSNSQFFSDFFILFFILVLVYSYSGAHKSGILLRNRFLHPPSEISGAAQIHQNRHGKHRFSRFLPLSRFLKTDFFFFFLLRWTKSRDVTCLSGTRACTHSDLISISTGLNRRIRRRRRRVFFRFWTRATWWRRS